MVKRTDQVRIREVVKGLRDYAQHGERLPIFTATEAADIIEELVLSVFGIQEKLKEME